MSRSDQIAALCDAAPAEGLPVIFNGASPVYLGQVESAPLRTIAPKVDALLIVHRFTATYISKADALGRACVIAHG